MTRSAYLKLPKGNPLPRRLRCTPELYKLHPVSRSCAGQFAGTKPVSRVQFAQGNYADVAQSVEQDSRVVVVICGFEPHRLHHRRDLLPRSRTERKPAEVVLPVRCTKAAGRSNLLLAGTGFVKMNGCDRRTGAGLKSSVVGPGAGVCGETPRRKSQIWTRRGGGCPWTRPPCRSVSVAPAPRQLCPHKICSVSVQRSAHQPSKLGVAVQIRYAAPCPPDG